MMSVISGQDKNKNKLLEFLQYRVIPHMYNNKENKITEITK